MAGEKKFNSNLDVQGSIKATTVPNSAGTLVTFNDSTKVFGTRTNAQIFTDIGLTDALASKEPAFTKNTGFNKNFGTTVGTVAQGDDSRFHAHSNKSSLDSIDQSLAMSSTPYFTGLNIGGGINCYSFTYGFAVNINYQDLNDIRIAGFYDGLGLTNAPSSGWFYITVERHSGGTAWVKQTVTSFAQGAYSNFTYIRLRENSVWSTWKLVITEDVANEKYAQIGDIHKQVHVITSRDLNATDMGAILKIKANVTLNIPSGLPTNFNIVARTYSGCTLTITNATGVTLDADGTTLVPRKSMTLYKDGSSETFVIIGDIS